MLHSLECQAPLKPQIGEEEEDQPPFPARTHTPANCMNKSHNFLLQFSWSSAFIYLSTLMW